MLRGARLGLGLVAALAVGACARAEPVAPPRDITIAAAALPLNPEAPDHNKEDNFAYAGGVALTSAETPRLHGLSDIAFTPDSAVVLQGDQADVVTARLVLDSSGRLTGLAEARLSALADAQGMAFDQKLEWADAEGVAILANGDRLVSFEDHDRILVYPAKGGPPRPAPMPSVAFRHNNGMEALAALPALGPDVYLTGSEDTGQTWICRLSAACVEDRQIPVPPGAGLVAATAVPAGGIAYLTRAYTPATGNQIRLLIFDAKGAQIGELALQRPLTVDNFEGVAAQARPDGRTRFYLISDDNFSGKQRTLLLAFDWTPPTR